MELKKLEWHPLSLSHLEYIHPAIYGNVSTYFYPFKTESETREWIIEAIRLHAEGKKEEYVIFDEGKFIGMVSPDFKTTTEVEIGLWITPPEQGKGYGKRILEELFERLEKRGVKRVLYETDKDNLPSIKLAESLNLQLTHSESMLRFVKELGGVS
jgi:RimJ/RimL family protein N-acetyltransferase